VKLFDKLRSVCNMLEDNFVGHMNTSKYAKLAKCSNDTALRDIQELTARGFLYKILEVGEVLANV